MLESITVPLCRSAPKTNPIQRDKMKQQKLQLSSHARKSPLHGLPLKNKKFHPQHEGVKGETQAKVIKNSASIETETCVSKLVSTALCMSVHTFDAVLHPLYLQI